MQQAFARFVRDLKSVERVKEGCRKAKGGKDVCEVSCAVSNEQSACGDEHAMSRRNGVTYRETISLQRLMARKYSGSKRVELERKGAICSVYWSFTCEGDVSESNRQRSPHVCTYLSLSGVKGKRGGPRQGHLSIDRTFGAIEVIGIVLESNARVVTRRIRMSRWESERRV